MLCVNSDKIFIVKLEDEKRLLLNYGRVDTKNWSSFFLIKYALIIFQKRDDMKIDLIKIKRKLESKRTIQTD